MTNDKFQKTIANTDSTKKQRSEKERGGASEQTDVVTNLKCYVGGL